MNISIDSIDFISSPDTNLEDVQGIADSIKEVGLSHPIIVRPANGSSERFLLVSGEKRLLAVQKLGWTEIPVEVRSISEREGMIVRAHENLRRHNLAWWEASELIEALHLMRQDQHGVGTKGRPEKGTEKTGWGVRDTAAELGKAIGSTAEDLQLARAVRLNPSLRNVKDRKTAVRLIKVAVIRHDAETNASAPTSIDVNQAFHGDSATILSNFPSGSIDHCVTDPPWLNFFEKGLSIDERTLPVFREVFRVLKMDSFLFLFAGWDDVTYYTGFDEVKETPEGVQVVHRQGALEKIGFRVAKTPIIWRKMKALSRRGVRSWEYDRDFEFILVAVKGNPALSQATVISGFKDYDAVPSRCLIHPNEKPEPLLEDILQDMSYEGNIILDPFGGSFVTASACKKLKRRFIICERDHETYLKGRARLGIKE